MWTDILRSEVQRADVLIFIGSRDALWSKWKQAEWEFFCRDSTRSVIAIIFRSIIPPAEISSPLLASLLIEDESALSVGPSPTTLHDVLVQLAGFEPTIRRASPPIARQQAKRPLNEGKLILVGRGEVGKTSLVRRLVDNNFRGDESKTQGINITAWPLRSDFDTFRLNIWDFGGQEIMHATHQFFLTERSIYLLVLNGREGGEDLDAEYWLKHIESFGGDSPVLVVQNKIAQHPFELNYEKMNV